VAFSRRKTAESTGAWPRPWQVQIGLVAKWWVEGHLNRNFRKLELDSRDQLQAILGDASPVAS
jgi:hypothetical protein